MLVQTPNNMHGKLTREQGYANSVPYMHLPAINPHGLVALNMNLFSRALDPDSFQAGEYADQAICMPTALVVAINQNDTQDIDFTLGGHSTATAMLAAFVTYMRNQYPTLSHAEIMESILRTGQKDMTNYKPEIHGQGLLDVTAALEYGARLVANHQAPQEAWTAPIKPVQEMLKTLNIQDQEHKAALPNLKKNLFVQEANVQDENGHTWKGLLCAIQPNGKQATIIVPENWNNLVMEKNWEKLSQEETAKLFNVMVQDNQIEPSRLARPVVLDSERAPNIHAYILTEGCWNPMRGLWSWKPAKPYTMGYLFLVQPQENQQ
jgi:hypothetical protein